MSEKLHSEETDDIEEAKVVAILSFRNVSLRLLRDERSANNYSFQIVQINISQSHPVPLCNKALQLPQEVPSKTIDLI